VKIRLVAVGQRLASWIGDGYADFAKRLPSHLDMRLVEIPSQHRKAGSVHKIRALEADKILNVLQPQEWVVLLDERGKLLDTAQLSMRFHAWQELGRGLAFVIGGADGVDERVRSRADETLALASATYPHGLVRVMLAEQLYRVWSVTTGHPYHRA
jgi:23S rRNA (pseudouridine1915-N3)-methyltransferase|tara:strand:- start:2363 stop:2830 length:468 start_codon:yes stop_codon:yes gene_type:complete